MGAGSARIDGEGLTARTFGARLEAGPAVVSVRQAQDATGQWLLATQDGYVGSLGLLQERRLFVDARGQEVRGEDILTVADARARVQFDAQARDGRMGFAVRFHLHPAVGVEFDPAQQVVGLTLPSGDLWMFRVGGGEIELEPSVYFDPGGAGAAADDAGGCPRGGRRVSRPDHLVLRPHRRGACGAVTDPCRR